MAKSLKGVLKLVYPINGIQIEDWSGLEKLFHKKFYTDLRIDPAEKDVGIVIPPLITRENLLKLSDIMFDTFNVKALYLIPEPVAISLFNRKLNSIILHSGYSYTYLAHIKNGLLEGQSVKILTYGMRNIAEYFRKLVKMDHRVLDNDSVIDILIKNGHVSLNIQDQSFVKFNYMLPDGSTLYFDKELYLAFEILFNPNIIGLEQKGISIAMKDYYEEVNEELPMILAGGCVFVDGFATRLEIESEMKIKTHISDDFLYQEWKGASFLIKKGYIKPFPRNQYKQDPKSIFNYLAWY